MKELTLLLFARRVAVGEALKLWRVRVCAGAKKSKSSESNRLGGKCV